MATHPLPTANNPQQRQQHKNIPAKWKVSADTYSNDCLAYIYLLDLFLESLAKLFYLFV